MCDYIMRIAKKCSVVINIASLCQITKDCAITEVWKRSFYCDNLQDEPEGQPSEDESEDESISSDEDDKSWVKEVQQQHRYRCAI